MSGSRIRHSESWICLFGDRKNRAHGAFGLAEFSGHAMKDWTRQNLDANRRRVVDGAFRDERCNRSIDSRA